MPWKRDEESSGRGGQETWNLRESQKRWTQDEGALAQSREEGQLVWNGRMGGRGMCKKQHQYKTLMCVTRNNPNASVIRSNATDHPSLYSLQYSCNPKPLQPYPEFRNKATKPTLSPIQSPDQQLRERVLPSGQQYSSESWDFLSTTRRLKSSKRS